MQSSMKQCSIRGWSRKLIWVAVAIQIISWQQNWGLGGCSESPKWGLGWQPQLPTAFGVKYFFFCHQNLTKKWALDLNNNYTGFYSKGSIRLHLKVFYKIHNDCFDLLNCSFKMVPSLCESFVSHCLCWKNQCSVSWQALK